jgi:hypothetical protein
VLGADQGHVAFEITGSPGVLTLEERDNFFLRRGLLSVGGIEGVLRRLDCEAAVFDEFLCAVLELCDV